MSTFMANAQTIERKWYILDAAGKPMGRTAAKAAAILRGKHKVDFTPHADCGDFVIIINAKEAVLTGNKLTQKYYRTHSGYVGGLKETQYKTLMATKPELAMRLACAFTLPMCLGGEGLVLAEPAAWLGAIILLVPVYFIRERKYLNLMVDRSAEAD